MGVDEAVYLSRDYDRINDRIYRRSKNGALEGIIEQSRAVHAALLTSVERLTDADLQRPVRSFLPADSRDDDGRGIGDLIHANTADHYAEHLNWIEALVGG